MRLYKSVAFLSLLVWHFCLQDINAQELSQGSNLEVRITDELILPTGSMRKVLRDENNNLITFPGDLIKYTITAINRGATPAYSVEIVDPIPPGTEYVPNSAAGGGMTILFSADGGKFYQNYPILYELNNDDGTIERRPIPPGWYTHVKWVVNEPIQPRATVTATMEVRIPAAEN